MTEETKQSLDAHQRLLIEAAEQLGLRPDLQEVDGKRYVTLPDWVGKLLLLSTDRFEALLHDVQLNAAVAHDPVISAAMDELPSLIEFLGTRHADAACAIYKSDGVVPLIKFAAETRESETGVRLAGLQRAWDYNEQVTRWRGYGIEPEIQWIAKVETVVMPEWLNALYNERRFAGLRRTASPRVNKDIIDKLIPFLWNYHRDASEAIYASGQLDALIRFAVETAGV